MTTYQGVKTNKGGKKKRKYNYCKLKFTNCLLYLNKKRLLSTKNLRKSKFLSKTKQKRIQLITITYFFAINNHADFLILKRK